MLIQLAMNDLGIIFGPSNLEYDLVQIKVDGLNLPKINLGIAYNTEIANKAGSAFIKLVKDNFDLVKKS